MRLSRRGPSSPTPLHTRIFLGLVAGGASGTVASFLLLSRPELSPSFEWLLENLIEPVGQVFLRLLLMIVIPLVFASLSLGVARLGDIRRLSRIGLRTFAYFLLVTTVAVVVGLTLVNLVRPGGRMSVETQARILESYRGEVQERAPEAPQFGVDTFVRMIPRNPVESASRGDILAVIVFSLMFGVGLILIPPENAQPVMSLLEGIGQVMVAIINLVMRLAPYGVFALVFSVTARFGWEVLQQLLYFVLVVLFGLLLMQFGLYPILVRTLGRMDPVEFFRKVRTVMVTAFSTSSSSATLPTTLKTAKEELRLPSEISGFVLPLGATMNMNGTALFEGVTVLFIAQVWGVELALGQQLLVVLVSVVAAIGAAGVPGGAIPLLMVILQMVGVPAEGIALVLGVDRLLDMARTVVNVTGDLTAALYISRTYAHEEH